MYYNVTISYFQPRSITSVGITCYKRIQYATPSHYVNMSLCSNGCIVNNLVMVFTCSFVLRDAQVIIVFIS